MMRNNNEANGPQRRSEFCSPMRELSGIIIMDHYLCLVFNEVVNVGFADAFISILDSRPSDQGII